MEKMLEKTGVPAALKEKILQCAATNNWNEEYDQELLLHILIELKKIFFVSELDIDKNYIAVKEFRGHCDIIFDQSVLVGNARTGENITTPKHVFSYDIKNESHSTEIPEQQSHKNKNIYLVHYFRYSADDIRNLLEIAMNFLRTENTLRGEPDGYVVKRRKLHVEPNKYQPCEVMLFEHQPLEQQSSIIEKIVKALNKKFQKSGLPLSVSYHNSHRALVGHISSKSLEKSYTNKLENDDA